MSTQLAENEVAARLQGLESKISMQQQALQSEAAVLTERLQAWRRRREAIDRALDELQQRLSTGATSPQGGRFDAAD